MGEATDKMRTADLEEESLISNEGDNSYGTSETSDEENPQQLRADIEDTRAEMSQTINEIQERLSPEHLLGQVTETVRDATIGKVERVMEKVGETLSDVTEPAREAMGRAGTTIKETGMSVADGMWKNPIPVALIGLGLGMFVMRRFRRNDHSYMHPRTSPGAALDLGQQTGPTTSTLNKVKESATDFADRSTSAISNLGTKARDGVSECASRFGQVVRDNPLVIGAVAVAAGTALGLALPSTKFESDYVGETGEKLLGKAQEVARGALDQVQQAASQIVPQPEGA